MEKEESIHHGSLPDQLGWGKSSTHTDEEPLRAVPPKILIKKRNSSKLMSIMQGRHRIKRRAFTSGVLINENNAVHLEKEVCPYGYPKDLGHFAFKLLNKAWRNDERIIELQRKVFEKNSCRGRNSEGLLNRLYVAEPRAPKGKTVYDVDPNYNTAVADRPINDKLSVREYIDAVRESLRTKIVIGYREDDITLIEETLKLEQHIIDILKENLTKYINAFEDFLIVDHKTAMNLLHESEVVAKLAHDKYIEHKKVAKKYAFIRSLMYTLEEKWKSCKAYQKFLHNVSPLTWRMQQERRNRRTSIYMMDQTTDDVFNIFGKHRPSLVKKGISLEDIIKEFREEIAHDKPPQLYFTRPEELLDVFRFIEMQNLNSLLHSEELAVPLKSIKEGMKYAEEVFNREIKQMQEIIDKLESGISWEEQRVSFLEQLAVDLIKNVLKNLVKDENILNLHVLVEDIYERKIAANDANLSISQMMILIEHKYWHELMLLDKVPSQQVVQLEGNYYAEEMTMLRLAERAAKQFVELNKITETLKKSFDPPPEKKGKELKRRSHPIEDIRKIQEPPRSLSTEEKDYLEFFTDFCEYTDNLQTYDIKSVMQDIDIFQNKEL